MYKLFLKSIKINSLIQYKVLRYQSTSITTTSVAAAAEAVVCKHYKLETQLFKKILSNELLQLVELFKKNNHQLRIAGGAVRDLLMEIEPNDIDLATDALPNQMVDLFHKENIRIFNLNGLKHGTVAIRMNDKSNFELTTLRIDVKTYGRHAEVEFTNDWHKDAIRRDLTVNSLFLDFDGQIIDYVNGVEDLKNRIVKFVGIPDKRVKEDYLRILRYFRFHSKVCSTPDKHDAESIKAIKDNVDGLKKISAERIGYETRKILRQKFSNHYLKMLYEFGISEHMGLPKNGDLENYDIVYNHSFEHKPEPITLIKALLKTTEDIVNLNLKIKLSNEEKHILHALFGHVTTVEKLKSNEEILDYFKKQLVHPKSNKDRSLNRNEAIEILKYTNRSSLIDKIKSMQLEVFPIVYTDFVNHKMYDETSKEFKSIEFFAPFNKINHSYLIRDLKLKWIDSNCSMTKQDMLNLIDINFLKKYIKKKHIINS